jgi:hypothetical protein
LDGLGNWKERRLLGDKMTAMGLETENLLSQPTTIDAFPDRNDLTHRGVPVSKGEFEAIL